MEEMNCEWSVLRERMTIVKLRPGLFMDLCDN